MLMIRYTILVAILCSILSGCNLSQSDAPTSAPQANDGTDGVVFVTPTPDPNAATATPTNTPTVPPTPTVDPTILIQYANNSLINGYFEEAIGTYQAVLQQGESAPVEQRAEAALQIGRAALREGLFDVAVDSLTQVITEFPEDSRVPQAYFLRGDAYLGLSQWQAAIDDFQQYLQLRSGLIDSYVYERIGDAQLALGQTETALASYEQALTANRILVPQLVLRERLAQIYINLGQIDLAVAQYDAILSVAQNAPYRASIDFSAAKALIDSGDTDRGILRMQRVFDNYTQTATAYDAMLILQQNGVTIDGLQRGIVSFNYGDYQGAIAAFDEYTSSYQIDAIPARLYLLQGRAYREIGNPSAALVAFQTIIEQFPQDPLFGDALLERGRTYFLSGDIPTAIETYLQIGDNYGYLSEIAAEALWRAGYLYGTNGEPDLSRQVFTQLANTYPSSTWSTNGLFLAAATAYGNNELVVAENLYGRLASISVGEDQAAAYLWVGRLALQRGDQTAAEESLNLAVAAAPDSYYAARALDIRLGRQPFTPPSNLQLQFDENAELAEAESWLRQQLAIEGEGQLWVLSPELAADPRLIRGNELWIVGAYDEAVQEFNVLLEEKRTAVDILSAYQLAIYFRGIGAYYSSIIAAADVIRGSGAGNFDAPRFLARMRYPVYYQELVIESAQQYEFDPLVLFALIRQESLYNASAISAADAIGLTQVIPSTGQYIASQLNWENFQSSDLLRPNVSIAFGGYYLNEQLNLFDGFVPAALAAYNGGPGNSLDWLALSGTDTDAFVTAITFDETRSYVQRIYSHYTIYRELYGMP